MRAHRSTKEQEMQRIEKWPAWTVPYFMACVAVGAVVGMLLKGIA